MEVKVMIRALEPRSRSGSTVSLP